MLTKVTSFMTASVSGSAGLDISLQLAEKVHSPQRCLFDSVC